MKCLKRKLFLNSKLVQEIPRWRFGMTICYIVWGKEVAILLNIEEGQSRVCESPLLSLLYHTLAMSFRAETQREAKVSARNLSNSVIKNGATPIFTLNISIICHLSNSYIFK
jgi:hypothetical protein